MPNLDRALRPSEMPGAVQIADAFRHVLGNTCRISRTAASYAWNVTGPGARGASACFSEQAVELHASLDDIASHIRDLGACAILDYSDRVVTMNPPHSSHVPDIDAMFLNMCSGHAQACMSIEAAIDVSRSCDDEVGIQVLSSRLAAHRRHFRITTMEMEGARCS